MKLHASACLGAGAALLVFLCLPSARATGSATWNVNPAGNIWYSSENWTPATVPKTIADTATFGVSNITTLFEAPGGYGSSLNAFDFAVGASAYTIHFSQRLTTVAEIETGVINDSGILQSFIVPSSVEFRDDNQLNNVVSFIDSATAGTLTQWTALGSADGAYLPSEIIFNNTSTAATAVFTIEPGGNGNEEDGNGYGGIIDFRNTSTADQATITVQGGVAGVLYGAAPIAYFTDQATAGNANITTTSGTASLSYGGLLSFLSDSTAGNAIITNNGGVVSGARPGQTTFYDTATADNATLIAHEGTSGANGGLILFLSDSLGGTSRCEVFGNGTLDIEFHNAPGLTVGSIEGDGIITLGANALTVGSNNLSTTFAGVVQDSGSGGSLVKVGSGTLTLSSANSYSGGTTVKGGVLAVNSQTGSGTGTGTVTVRTGTLSGDGILAGVTVIGTDRGAGAVLAPAGSTSKQATLTIQSALSLAGHAVYAYTFKNETSSDVVVANGISLAPRAFLKVRGPTDAIVPQGTTFTVFRNTAATPIVGTFGNLPDEGIVTLGVNRLQANYEGGDGNDLTLTVVP